MKKRRSTKSRSGRGGKRKNVPRASVSPQRPIARRAGGGRTMEGFKTGNPQFVWKPNTRTKWGRKFNITKGYVDMSPPEGNLKWDPHAQKTVPFT